MLQHYFGYSNKKSFSSDFLGMWLFSEVDVFAMSTSEVDGLRFYVEASNTTELRSLLHLHTGQRTSNSIYLERGERSTLGAGSVYHRMYV